MKDYTVLIQLMCDSDFIATHKWAESIMSKRTVGEMMDRYMLNKFINTGRTDVPDIDID